MCLKSELMDISRDWVSALGCFTSVVVCLWLFLSLVLSSASEMQLNRVEIRRLTLPLQNVPLFYLQNLLGCFAVCFVSSSICIMKRSPINFAPFDWIWAESISDRIIELIRLLLSSVTSSINTSNPEPLEAMQLMITLLHTLKNKGASKGSSSDAIEEPFLVPQRNIQSKVI